MKISYLLDVFIVLLLTAVFACKNSPTEPAEVTVVITASYTKTPTISPTPTDTAFCTATISPTFSVTQTAWVLIATETSTPPWTATDTVTQTMTVSPTVTHTLTATQTNTPACVVPYDGMVITEDTVLCPGTYDIQDPGHDGVIIIGAHNVTLNGNGAVIEDSSGPASGPIGVYNGAYYGVEIKNLTVKKYNWNIQLQNSSSNRVENCVAEGGSNGIAISGNSQNNIIGGNTLTANVFNVIIGNGPSGNTVTANIINGGGASGYGISLNNGVNANIIEKNLISGCTTAVDMQQVSDYNYITGNELSGGQVGLNLSDSCNIRAEYNNIHGFSYAGIQAGSPRTDVMIFINYNNIYDMGQYLFYNNQTYSGPASDMGFSHNWLGGTDCSYITSMIIDKSDNAAISEVLFQPFYDAPYPSGSQAFCP